jgi:hypothetical protein
MDGVAAGCRDSVSLSLRKPEQFEIDHSDVGLTHGPDERQAETAHHAK